VGEISQKMRFFAAHKDEFDTIFIGSSRIRHGVSPSAFDETLARAGIPSHSFNFGADGMHPPERFYVLEKILAMKPHNLKRLFLEMDHVETTWLPDQPISQRVVYWHDWKRTKIILRKILDVEVHEPWRRKLGTLWNWRGTIALHITLFAKNVCNVGRAFDLAKPLGGDNQAKREMGPNLDGSVPSNVTISGEKAAALENELARERSAPIENIVLDRYAAGAYRDYVRQIRKAGATPVLLVTPVVPQYPSQFPGITPCLLLAYNNPIVYPDLYRSDARWDEAHLNPVGADKFTRLVARDFLKNTQQP
jgi:hypothetical protein